MYLKHLSSFFEAIPDALVITDLRGNILLINSCTKALFGYTRRELLTFKINHLIPETLERNQHLYQYNHEPIPCKRSMNSSLILIGIRKNKSTFPINSSLSPIAYEEGPILLFTIRDISEQQLIENKLKHLAEHDALTGLITRPLFEDRIVQGMALAQRNNQSLGILFIDIDNFKFINDHFGHDIGNLILSSAAQSMKTCIRATDTLARVGGDEFAALLLNINDVNDAKRIAKKILKCFTQGLVFHHHKHALTVSIGISLYSPTMSSHLRTLMIQADSAMYYVKEHGKNNYKLFDDHIKMGGGQSSS